MHAGSHLLTQCAVLPVGVALESPQVKKEQWLRSQEAGDPELLCWVTYFDCPNFSGLQGPALPAQFSSSKEQNNMKLLQENESQRDRLQLINRLCFSRPCFRGLFGSSIPFPIETILKMMVRFPGSHSKTYLNHNVTEIAYICEEKEQEKYCCNTSN